jgi:hypothetical protein
MTQNMMPQRFPEIDGVTGGIRRLTQPAPAGPLMV